VRSWRWKHAGGRFSALPPQPCAGIDPVQNPWTPPVFILDLGMDAVSLVLPSLPTPSLRKFKRADMTTTTASAQAPQVPRIALIAHDKKKDDMISLAAEYLDFLKGCTLSATGTTGGRLINELGLSVERKHSGPVGGDLQIGAQLVDGLVDCVIFLRDPMTPQPHEPDINALVRACDVHNVPCATNVSTARLVLSQLQGTRS
jgi:methylglyoxal synthase